MYVSFKLLEMFQCTYYEIVYLSSALAYEVNIKQLCSSAICIQNVSLSSRLSDSVQCVRGLYVRAWGFETLQGR